jgi:hypothetical protein
MQGNFVALRKREFMAERNLKWLAVGAFVLAGLVLGAPLALADSITEFQFSFSSTDHAVSGSGTLDVTLNSDSVSYTATSGSITLPDPTVSSSTGGFKGTFALEPTTGDSVYSAAGESPDGSDYYLSKSGYFYYDNQLYYPQPNADLNGFLLDVGGLLFSNGASPTPEEINLYQSGNYVYYQNDGTNEAVNFTLTPIANGAVTGGSAVPLPPAAGVGFAMLAGLGVFAGLRRRLGRSRLVAVSV